MTPTSASLATSNFSKKICLSKTSPRSPLTTPHSSPICQWTTPTSSSQTQLIPLLLNPKTFRHSAPQLLTEELSLQPQALLRPPWPTQMMSLWKFRSLRMLKTLGAAQIWPEVLDLRGCTKALEVWPWKNRIFAWDQVSYLMSCSRKLRM